MIIVNQRSAKPVRVAAEIVKGLQSDTAPAAARQAARGHDSAIFAKNLPIRIGDALRIERRRTCVSPRPADRLDKSGRKLVVPHCTIPSREALLPCRSFEYSRATNRHFEHRPFFCCPIFSANAYSALRGTEVGGE